MCHVGRFVHAQCYEAMFEQSNTCSNDPNDSSLLELSVLFEAGADYVDCQGRPDNPPESFELMIAFLGANGVSTTTVASHGSGPTSAIATFEFDIPITAIRSGAEVMMVFTAADYYFETDFIAYYATSESYIQDFVTSVVVTSTTTVTTIASLIASAFP